MPKHYKDVPVDEVKGLNLQIVYSHGEKGYPKIFRIVENNLLIQDDDYLYPIVYHDTKEGFIVVDEQGYFENSKGYVPNKLVAYYVFEGRDYPNIDKTVMPFCYIEYAYLKEKALEAIKKEIAIEVDMWGCNNGV